MVDDRRDRVEESEMLHPRRLADAGRKRGRGERAGGNDGHALGRQRVDAFADDLDIGVIGERAGDGTGKDMAVDRQRGACGHFGGFGARHDERIQPPHFLMQQADGIFVGIIGTEAVGADQFGEAFGLVRGRHVATPAHFRQAHLDPRLRQLPRRFGPGQPAADDMHLIVCH